MRTDSIRPSRARAAPKAAGRPLSGGGRRIAPAASYSLLQSASPHATRPQREPGPRASRRRASEASGLVWGPNGARESNKWPSGATCAHLSHCAQSRPTSRSQSSASCRPVRPDEGPLEPPARSSAIFKSTQQPPQQLARRRDRPASGWNLIAQLVNQQTVNPLNPHRRRRTKRTSEGSAASEQSAPDADRKRLGRVYIVPAPLRGQTEVARAARASPQDGGRPAATAGGRPGAAQSLAGLQPAGPTC